MPQFVHFILREFFIVRGVYNRSLALGCIDCAFLYRSASVLGKDSEEDRRVTVSCLSEFIFETGKFPFSKSSIFNFQVLLFTIQFEHLAVQAIGGADASQLSDKGDVGGFVKLNGFRRIVGFI